MTLVEQRTLLAWCGRGHNSILGESLVITAGFLVFGQSGSTFAIEVLFVRVTVNGSGSQHSSIESLLGWVYLIVILTVAITRTSIAIAALGSSIFLFLFHNILLLNL